MEHVGRRIRQYRLLKGLSQQQLADLIHKGRPLISHIENTGKVNHATLISLCKALQVDAEQLTSLSEEPFASVKRIEIHETELMKAEIERLKNELLLKDEIIALQKDRIREMSSRLGSGK